MQTKKPSVGAGGWGDILCNHTICQTLTNNNHAGSNNNNVVTKLLQVQMNLRNLSNTSMPNKNFSSIAMNL